MIRGQRPPSTQWPKFEQRTERKSSVAPEVPSTSSRETFVSTKVDAQGQRVSRDPDHAEADAVRARKLEGAIFALGRDDPAVSGPEKGVAARSVTGTGEAFVAAHRWDAGSS